MLNRRIQFAPAVLVAACLTGSVHAGSITGTVKYDGPVPASMKQPLQMNADPACALKHKSPVLPEALVLGPGQTLAHVFVQVKKGLPEKAWPTPAQPLVMNQEGCLYTPHVMGIMVNQPFKILNSDGLLHNVHALPKINAGFNRAMPANVKEAEFKFAKEEEMFKIKCDVHPWMGAWIQVMKHPYFAVTGTDGKYAIKDLGPGTYEIEVWHEKLKTKTATVKISGDEAQVADFTFTPPQKAN
ncbi:MAG: carboxypeptidase regulatory-like domain-containing protein [Candidatus Polarisedimenticolia bacterium]